MLKYDTNKIQILADEELVCLEARMSGSCVVDIRWLERQERYKCQKGQVMNGKLVDTQEPWN